MGVLMGKKMTKNTKFCMLCCTNLCYNYGFWSTFSSISPWTNKT